MSLDLTNQRYGRLQVLTLSSKRGSRNQRFWECICDCGNLTHTSVESLRRGDTKSCGCLHKETATQTCLSRTIHGESSRTSTTPLYYLWTNMKTRCNNPNWQDYADYGGRGIYVHPEWQTSFEAFRTYINTALGDRPAGYSFDRIDNDGPYAPGNVRWASPSQQSLNQRSRRK